MFPAREANFEPVTYRSLERSPQIAVDAGYSAQALVLPGHFGTSIFGHFWFSSSGSFIGFHHWGGPISKSLAYLFTIGVRTSAVEKVAWERERWRLRIYFMPPSFRFVYFSEWRVTLSKLLWNFEWTLRTRTPNCRVRVIDFYSVLLTNFRIASLSPADTII